ncbi:related to non-ribosomal peptide synthetase [Rhynchosporium secalis]|uniref:Related to non-ribosomal peptide synthetase n=1 Tax=Rhynchosporium secalis TaxID=38038 RepID=A0A1E1MSW1_RHYSE|nr:related to non-ribosomal peptide synthetase [Rhynchosporium secalis]
MPPTWNHSDLTQPEKANTEFDDVEKGFFNSISHLPTLPPSVRLDEKPPSYVDSTLWPISPVHEGTTPFSSVPVLALSWPGNGKPPALTPVAPKKPVRESRWIRAQLWFNTYRKFFTFVTLLNLAGIIMLSLGRFPYAETHTGALVLGNLLVAVMMRNELFLRFLYLIAIYGLRSWAPTWVKLSVTSILQHVGGIHSGCALSGAAWLVYKVVEIIRHRSVQHRTVIVTGMITNVMILTSVLSAFPWVRNYHHNVFERHHRFIGWLGLASTWCFVILGNSYDIKHGEWRHDAHSLLSAQELWFALFMTIFILIPWLTLRKVPVEVEIPSPKVAVLRFDRGIQQGLLGRISRTSIMEYHAFGIVSEGTKSPYHYMICGVQGDFTESLVRNPPKFVWTRELKFAGVGHASAMFKRGIRICTGTGIGAALSTCIQNPNWFLIWIGSDQEKTFGPTIAGLIHDNIPPERMILWDSKKRGGRPDTMQLLKDTWKSFGAEVIFITSNMKGNDEMMQGCHAGMSTSLLVYTFRERTSQV